MTAAVIALLKELSTLHWLSNCGTSAAFEDHRHDHVSSHEGALAQIDGPAWAGFRLMLRNRTANSLARACYDRFTTWNPFILAITPAVKEQVRTIAELHPWLSSTALLEIEKDIKGVCYEIEFADTVPPLFFVERLWPIYQSGHLPCGWNGPELDTIWSGTTDDPVPAGLLVYH